MTQVDGRPGYTAGSQPHSPSGDELGKVCPYCRFAFVAGDSVTTCPVCELPHHTDCWTENEGCTTYGCTGESEAPQPTPASVDPEVTQFPAPTPAPPAPWAVLSFLIALTGFFTWGRTAPLALLVTLVSRLRGEPGNQRGPGILLGIVGCVLLVIHLALGPSEPPSTPIPKPHTSRFIPPPGPDVPATYIPCPTCHGRTWVHCANCNGDGKLHCIQCNGVGTVMCKPCHGSGQGVWPGSGCPFCKGSKRRTCSPCHGSGWTTCSPCNGYGKKWCWQCNGQGKLRKD